MPATDTPRAEHNRDQVLPYNWSGHWECHVKPDLALRIEKAFGVATDIPLRMQAWHDDGILTNSSF